MSYVEHTFIHLRYVLKSTKICLSFNPNNKSIFSRLGEVRFALPRCSPHGQAIAVVRLCRGSSCIRSCLLHFYTFLINGLMY
jgi:hypothetical protein